MNQNTGRSSGKTSSTPTTPPATPDTTPGDATDPVKPNAPEKPGTGSQSPGRTIESPGQPGLEKEPNREKAIGPGGQRLTSGTSAPVNDVQTPGVDKPDGVTTIDPTGETTAEETKLL